MPSRSGPSGPRAAALCCTSARMPPQVGTDRHYCAGPLVDVANPLIGAAAWIAAWYRSSEAA